jgi:hypothetical protein
MTRMDGRTAVVGIPGGAALAAEGRRDLRPWRLPALLVGAVLACLATLALATLPAPSRPSAHPLTARHGLQTHRATRLPLSLAGAASASIGASEHGFWPVRHGASLLTQGGGIHSTFTASGAALRAGQGTLGLSLTGLGRGQRVERVATVAPTGAASQVLYRHGSISEFYRNGPYGLEQGFTVGQRPTAGEGSLVLALSVAGSLVPRQVGSQVLFRTHAGATVLLYGQLSALDATGRRLSAHIQLRNGTLQLQIDDSHARYPLRIDPFIQQGEKLTASDETKWGNNYGSNFGTSVALSRDGNTALIGGASDNANVGAAWVFTRSGSTWTQQGQKLTPSDANPIRPPSFGYSVALSGDGNTALIGSEHGGAWVFTRAGATWTQQGSKLPAGFGFGESVALSGDGNTALLGSPGDNSSVGAAVVLTRSGSTWTQQGEKLTASDEIGQGAFGTSVALSGDGNTALIGGVPSNNNEGEVGTAWVFTRSGETWEQQGQKLTAGEEGSYQFGVGVALSGDGNTALIGGIGAAWVFTRSDSTWTQQGQQLTASDASEPADFGRHVALSADGNTALIGGESDNSGVGAAWVFARSRSTWTQQGSKLTAAGDSGEGFFGSSVALSGDGNTALIGGEGDNAGIGAAWVFVNTVVTEPASSVTQTSATLNATVNPNGQTVSDCHFEYGETTAYGKEVSCSPSPGSGTTPEPVSESVTGLSANTTYHFRIVATNAGGTSEGSDQTFTTLLNSASGTSTNSSSPATATDGPVSATASGGTGTVTAGQYGSNPTGTTLFESSGKYIDVYLSAGSTFTKLEFEDCELNGGNEVFWESGSGWAKVIRQTYTPGSTPCITVEIESSGTTPELAQMTGTVFGVARSPVPPKVVTGKASSVTQTSATLNATVNPEGSNVSDCKFEYGETIPYSKDVPCSTSPGSGTTPEPVSASVTGLSANTTYHFRISATNAGDTSKGADETFKTPPQCPATPPKVLARWHYSAHGSAGKWSPPGEMKCGKTTTLGPSPTEAVKKVGPGELVKAGYDFQLPKNKTTFTVTFAGGTVVLKVRCVSGAKPSQPTFKVEFPTQSYTVKGDEWVPSKEEKSPLVYQGATAAPNVCGGGQLEILKEQTFSAFMTIQ